MLGDIGGVLCGVEFDVHTVYVDTNTYRVKRFLYMRKLSGYALTVNDSGVGYRFQAG